MRPRFNPATRRRRTLLTLTIGFVGIGICCIGLFSSCIGTASIDTLESDKSHLVAVARTTLPEIAAFLDGQLLETTGEWAQSGIKIDVRYYRIETSLVVTPRPAQDSVDALTEAGFTITLTPDDSAKTAIIGQLDNVTITVFINQGDPTQTIILESQRRTMRPRTPPSRPYGEEVIEID